tara:strand:+ start:577 stop:1068 length:492 start_codon:yes stop_codon:yes gene_type:complete
MTRIINTIKLNENIAYLQKLKSLNKESGLIFNSLDNILNDFIGHKLFTILKFDKINSKLERIYTSNPREYPLQGKKDVIRNFWQVQVLEKGIAYIGYNSQDIKNSFSDFDLIKKLGCSSVLIIPVKSGGNIKGSVNLLHEESWYSNNHVKIAQSLVSVISEAL